MGFIEKLKLIIRHEASAQHVPEDQADQRPSRRQL